MSVLFVVSAEAQIIANCRLILSEANQILNVIVAAILGNTVKMAVNLLCLRRTNMNLISERKAEIHAWIADMLQDPDCLFLDTQTETELAAIDFMIMYYQRELSPAELEVCKQFNSNCIFCAIYNSCDDCLWTRYTDLLDNSENDDDEPCILWLNSVDIRTKFKHLFLLGNTKAHTERIAMLYRWRADISAILPDGNIYCGECFQETSISRIVSLEPDQLRYYEYLSACCSDDRFYSNAACTIQFSPAEIAELWRDVNE